MEALLAVLGGALLVGVLADALTTTVGASSGAGWMTGRLSAVLWTVARTVVGRRHQALGMAGVVIMLTSIVVWLLLTWLGWTLLFLSAPDAVVSTTGAVPASTGERFYFAGYTLVTLGNGEYQPSGIGWQLATVLAAGNGFILVTLGISYLVPLTSAVAHRRQLAAYVSSLGRTPEGIVAGAWDGHGLDQLAQDLQQLPHELFLLEQRHLTYPVLHYFHSADPATSAPVQLAALDEALTLIDAAVPPTVGMPARTLTSTRTALTRYLRVVQGAYVRPAEEAPPPPRIAALRAAGVPTVDDAAFLAAMRAAEERRRLLHGLVAHAAWSWEDVVGSR